MTRKPWPFPTAESHPKPGPDEKNGAVPAPPSVEVQEVSEPALDHAVEESFPASDPVSVVATKVVADVTTGQRAEQEKPDTISAQAAVRDGKPPA